jgi:3-hydroxyisobutyrate dehydrogenase-like beta-hydroxyacid dehydrogenase
MVVRPNVASDRAGMGGRPLTLALLHPGAMGSSLGAALVRAGHAVRWLDVGRSAATAERARTAGLSAAGSWGELLDGADAVLSICPPDAATAVAEQFVAARAEHRRRGPDGLLYVDANAVSPQRAAAVASLVRDGGADFVDGDVVGPPVGQGRTCVYLSGMRAGEVEAWFRPGDPLTVVLGEDPTAASALKMLYAGWTKGTSALLLALWATAVRTGVGDALLAEWRASQPDVVGRLEKAAAGAVPKAWRFAGEMDEIADTLAGSDLPDGFHRAAAELYRQLSGFKDASPPPALDAVIDALLGRQGI